MEHQDYPIIIIGMHRSGTSMITRVLENLGLFMGEKKDDNGEAFFFRNLSDWFLSQSGGAWDNPEPVRYFLCDPEARALAVDYLEHLMGTPHVVSYLGWRKYLRYRSPINLDIPWGWKDPRATYMLPIWLELFPTARIVHVYRHGVDVANSLRVRQRRVFERSKVRHETRKRLYLYWLGPRKRRGFSNTFRCSSLDEGFNLWEAYFEEARRWVERLGNRAIEVKFEDFLAEPRQAITSLAAFCGLDSSEADIQQVSETIEENRAYAFRSNPELQAFATKVGERLAAKGYH